MDKTKNIALVAHDNKNKDLVEWVEWNYKILLDIIFSVPEQQDKWLKLY